MNINIFVVMMTLLSSSAYGLTYTVGPNGCDYTTINGALANNPDEILIVNGVYQETLQLQDQNITIKGGYANCQDAEANNQSTGRAAIDAGLLGSVITITESNNPIVNTITLERIEITNGKNDDLGGGLTILFANVNLELKDVWIRNNQGAYGGGILILSGTVNINANDTWINNNIAAVDGGGIYCYSENNSSSIHLNTTDDTLYQGIRNNQSTNGNGGGMFLFSCRLKSRLYIEDQSNGGISFNSASNADNIPERGHGGAIYAAGGSEVVITGDNHKITSLSHNSASGNAEYSGQGGAIYATGNGTSVKIQDFLATGNFSRQAGAVFHISSDAKLDVSSSDISFCKKIENCNVISNNTSDLGGILLAISEGGQASIKHTTIKENTVESEGSAEGVLLFSYGPNAVTHFESNYIYKNGRDIDYSLFHQQGPVGVINEEDYPLLKMYYNTIVNNYIKDDGNSKIITIISPGKAEIYSSIIFNSLEYGIPPQIIFLAGLNTVTNTNCLMIHNGSEPIDQGIAILEVDDPLFVNSEMDDYHILPQSPANDFCSDQFIQTEWLDSDGETRGWDDPEQDNYIGSYDIGADETYLSDIIFEDGLETGQ